MTDKTRYQKIREQDRRDKISITRCLKQLFDVQKILEEDAVLNVPALRLRADISLSLLKKRLPDLKAIEHRLRTEDKAFEEMTREELASEVARTRRELARTRRELAGNGDPSASTDKPSSVH